MQQHPMPHLSTRRRDGGGFTVSFPHPFCPQVDLFVAAHHYASNAGVQSLQPLPPCRPPASVQPDAGAAVTESVLQHRAAQRQPHTHVEIVGGSATAASTTTEAKQGGKVAAGAGHSHAAMQVAAARKLAGAAGATGTAAARPFFSLAAMTGSGMFASLMQSELQHVPLPLEELFSDDGFF